MGVPQLSASQLIVLRDLEKASGRAVVKAVLVELDAAGCWTFAEQQGHAVLRQGAAAVPERPACRRVAALIERTRPMPGAEHEVRRLRDVGRKAHQIEWRIVNDVLAELVELGLVELKEGFLRKRRHLRTSSGRELLGRPESARRIEAATVPIFVVMDGGAADARSRDFDGGGRDAFDSGYDAGSGPAGNDSGGGFSGGHGGGGWDAGGGGDSGGGGGCGSGGP